MRVPVGWSPRILFDTDASGEVILERTGFTDPSFFPFALPNMAVTRERREGAPGLDSWVEETIAQWLDVYIFLEPDTPPSISAVVPVLVSGLPGREFIHVSSFSASTTIEVLLVSGLDSYAISASVPNDEWPSFESTFRELVYSFTLLE